MEQAVRASLFGMFWVHLGVHGTWQLWLQCRASSGQGGSLTASFQPAWWSHSITSIRFYCLKWVSVYPGFQAGDINLTPWWEACQRVLQPFFKPLTTKCWKLKPGIPMEGNINSFYPPLSLISIDVYHSLFVRKQSSSLPVMSGMCWQCGGRKTLPPFLNSVLIVDYASLREEPWALAGPVAGNLPNVLNIDRTHVLFRAKQLGTDNRPHLGKYAQSRDPHQTSIYPTALLFLRISSTGLNVSSRVLQFSGKIQSQGKSSSLLWMQIVWDMFGAKELLWETLS